LPIGPCARSAFLTEGLMPLNEVLLSQSNLSSVTPIGNRKSAISCEDIFQFSIANCRLALSLA